jgi:hypothetical protein
MTGLLDIFEQITIAVERNDRVLLHEHFVALMQVQDRLAREHYVDCLYNGDSWEAVWCRTCGNRWRDRPVNKSW